MNKVLKWVLIGSGIALVSFCIALFVFRGFSAGLPMMSRFGGFDGYFGGMMFGMGFLMLFRLLIPLGVLALAVVGVAALIRNHKTNSQPTASVATAAPVSPARECVQCAKPMEADWKNCPYCGKKQ
ncbi:MAG: Uncharacterized protein FD147_2225 [Chloroflexi bacterium]|nr:MAG: Uncharacterized protein FD147_2225 [Chloroflexota bacterium]